MISFFLSCTSYNPEFVFSILNPNMSLVTKQIMFEFASVSSMRYVSNTVTSYLWGIAQFAVILGIAQIMP